MNLLKNFFAFILVFSFLPALSQFEIGRHTYNQSIVDYVNRDAEKIRNAKIQTRTCSQEEIGKNGIPIKSTVYYHYTYNERGQIVKEHMYYGRRKLQSSNEYTYNEKHQVIRKTHYSRKKEKPTFIQELAYFNDTLLSSINQIEDGKSVWSKAYFYADNGKIKEQRNYRKGKLTYRIEYDYYEDWSKKEVRYFKDSLKLETTFRYDCGIGNSLLSEKQKDTLTKCSRKEELADGTIRTIEETRDEKGRIRRNVTDVNKEQKWYEYRQYDAKNRITYSYKCTNSETGKVEVIHKSYRKGKLRDVTHSINWEDTQGFYSYQIMEEEQIERNYINTYTFHSSIN